MHIWKGVHIIENTGITKSRGFKFYHTIAEKRLLAAKKIIPQVTLEHLKNLVIETKTDGFSAVEKKVGVCHPLVEEGGGVLSL